MVKENIAYCGLNCKRCKEKFGKIKSIALDLEKAMDEVNFKEVAKAIPFMNSKYKGHKKLIDFFKNDCPGCREGGGNPFCGIRKCATKKGYFTCAECNSLCKKFNMLFKVHSDNEIQDNINKIKKEGIESIVNNLDK